MRNKNRNLMVVDTMQLISVIVLDLLLFTKSINLSPAQSVKETSLVLQSLNNRVKLKTALVFSCGLTNIHWCRCCCRCAAVHDCGGINCSLRLTLYGDDGPVSYTMQHHLTVNRHKRDHDDDDNSGR